MSVLGDLLVEKDFVVSILLLNLVALIPWLAFFLHAQNEGVSEDGPGAIFLLSTTAAGTLFALPFYSFAIYLFRFFHSVFFVRWVIVTLLTLVVVFCLCYSVIWASLSSAGSGLFLCAALGYAAFAIKLIQQIVSVIKVARVERTQ